MVEHRRVYATTALAVHCEHVCALSRPRAARLFGRTTMIKKTLNFGLGVLMLAGGGACGRTQAVLNPAPDATLVGGPGRGAVATAAGVRVAAHVGAWKWGPSDLD